METFRSNTAVLLALLCLACAGGAGAQQSRLDHVVPRPDYVGAHPTRLEWTAVAGTDSYAVTVENEIEMVMLEQQDVRTNSLPWPKQVRLEPGTYFWRVIAMKGGRIVADSGRAAFVVREP